MPGSMIGVGPGLAQASPDRQGFADRPAGAVERHEPGRGVEAGQMRGEPVGIARLDAAVDQQHLPEITRVHGIELEPPWQIVRKVDVGHVGPVGEVRQGAPGVVSAHLIPR